MAFLGSLISNALMTVGMKFNILGYISIGEIVPEVRTTFLNFENTGYIAILASKQ